MNLPKVLYTGTATATGGAKGKATSSDKSFELNLSTAKEMGGNGAPGTNPEQLFAAGYSACFLRALKYVAMNEKIKLPLSLAITGNVGIGPIVGGFGIETELIISIPGMERETVAALVEKAHMVCPYSNATRGNMKVSFQII